MKWRFYPVQNHYSRKRGILDDYAPLGFSQNELELGFPLSVLDINDVIAIECDVLLKKKAEFEMQIRLYWISYDMEQELKKSGLCWEGRNDNYKRTMISAK